MNPFLKEIPVGSYLMYDVNYIVVDISDLAVISKNPKNNYAPIVISEDVLRACNFEHSAAEDGWVEATTGFKLQEYEDGGYHYPRLYGSRVIFKELHKLQNFYRMVTNRELFFNIRKMK